MSSILKALRRLEEEQSRATPRPLREEVTGPSSDARSARPRTAWMPAALGVLGAGCLVLAAVLFWDRMGRETPMPEPAPVASRPPAEASASAPRTATTGLPPVAARVAASARRAAPTNPAPPRGVPAATSPPQARVMRDGPAVAPEPRREAAPAPRPAPEARSAAATPSAPTARVSPSRPSPTSSPARLPVAAPAPRRVARAPEREPVVERPPPVAAYPSLPGFRVTRTVWHPHSDRRLAFVRHDAQEQPLEVREGQVLEGGAVVLQIDPGAVVFLHRGNEIRRAVGGP